MIELMLLVEAQARDAGLWFNAQTAPEAYLQEALRTLHAAVEHNAGKDAAHPHTDRCGFDRNGSHNAGHYVCMCGWEDAAAPGLPEERRRAIELLTKWLTNGVSPEDIAEQIASLAALRGALYRLDSVPRPQAAIKSSPRYNLSGEYSLIYNIWRGMLRRCYTKTNRDYRRYGLRGIAVCARWHNFDNFYEDMGDRPKGKMIDRIDNDGPYSPENCHWVTPRESAENRSATHKINFNGESLTTRRWAEKLGVSRRTLRARLKRLPLEVALSPIAAARRER